MSRNANVTEVSLNPGDQHVCRAYSDRFSVVVDTTGVTSLNSVTFYVR